MFVYLKVTTWFEIISLIVVHSGLTLLLLVMAILVVSMMVYFKKYANGSFIYLLLYVDDMLPSIDLKSID